MKEQLETLKKWVQTGQVKTARGRSEDDLLTLIGQMEVALRQQPVSGKLPRNRISDIEHDRLTKVLYPKDNSKRFRR